MPAYECINCGKKEYQSSSWIAKNNPKGMCYRCTSMFDVIMIDNQLYIVKKAIARDDITRKMLEKEFSIKIQETN